MRYQSTRGWETIIESGEAIVRGLAPDGGLFVPVDMPQVSAGDLERLAAKSYKERALGILSLFLTDFTSEELENCVNEAYSKAKFETESIAPVYELEKGMFLLELWHGPTCAFKDMALQLLPHLLTVSMKKTGEKN